MGRKRSIFFFLVLLLGIWNEAAGQLAKLDPLAVVPSTLLSQVRSLKASNPKLTPDQLVEAANTLFEVNGINYSILFNAATCERLRKARDARKDPTAPLKIGASLQSVDAENARLALPDPQFKTAGCEDCLIELPMISFTDTDFIAVVKGRNIKFVLPQGFLSNEVVLRDPADPTKIKRRWHVPFRSTPMGVSFDENVLYVSLNDPALDDLSLAVFGEGVFQFATRTEAEDGGVGKVLEFTSTSSAGRTMQFNRWKKTYLVNYQPACPN